MAFSNKIDLNFIFSSLTSDKYVIIKLSENYPNYFLGSDIDIFCHNINSFAREILFYGTRFIETDLEMKINIICPSHIYIDYISNNKIEFRFDLYGKIPTYQKVKIKDEFFSHIIVNRIQKMINSQYGAYNIFIPSPIDEMILRYIEYREWYEIRPDKIKHLDYIMNTLSTDLEKKRFFEKLHNVTSLPEENKNKELFSISKERKILTSSQFISLIKLFKNSLNYNYRLNK